jgi:hypothetical protein
MNISIKYYKELSSKINFINGVAYWKDKPKYQNIDINEPAGRLINGYRQIGFSVNGVKKKIMAHRLHWFMVYGKIPTIIDHINRDRSDNRIENLREVDWSESNRNKKSWGASNYKGVVYREKQKKWVANCTINGKRKYLGSFKSEEDAAKAYDKFCLENNITHVNLNFNKDA